MIRYFHQWLKQLKLHKVKFYLKQTKKSKGVGETAFLPTFWVTSHQFNNAGLCCTNTFR